MKKILQWLSGKKSVIAGVITTTSAYLVSTNQITAEMAVLINGLCLTIFGTASYATGRVVYNK